MIECDNERWAEENPGHTVKWARVMWYCPCVECDKPLGAFAP